jgi:hypothetical protein
VELELDGVGAALGRDLGEADRVAETAVVIHPGLGDQEHAHAVGDASFAP